VANLGFEPTVLGRTRIEGIQLCCKDYGLKKQNGEENPEIPMVSGSSTNAQLKRMRHKLSYMEQQPISSKLREMA
jgi:hypothetical protein